MSNLSDSLTFQTGTQIWRTQASKILNLLLTPYFNTMARYKQQQYPKTTDNQLNQLFRQFSQISRNSSENTGLIIAYLSLLGFLSAGIFGIIGLLISQRSYILPQETHKPLPMTEAVIQPQNKTAGSPTQ